MTIRDLHIEVKRKCIKHMYLAVKPPYGQVQVRVPLLCTEACIRRFVLGKWDWIQAKRELLARRRDPAALQYVAGEPHLFLGRTYTLQILPTVAEKPHVEVEGQKLRVYVRRLTQATGVASLLQKWYKAQLEELLRDLVCRWAPRLQVPCPGIRVVQMRASWGRCHPATCWINFNLRLVHHPAACIEYVVVHELAHLLVPNHSPAFKALVSHHLPDWKQRKALLNES